MLMRSLWSKITQVHSFFCPRETCVDKRSWPCCHQVSNILSLSLSISHPILITTYQHDVNFKSNPQCRWDRQRSLWLPVQRATCQQFPHCCWFSQVGLRLILTKFPNFIVCSYFHFPGVRLQTRLPTTRRFTVTGEKWQYVEKINACQSETLKRHQNLVPLIEQTAGKK